MKHFLMTALILASTNVFAAKLVNIESFTNKTLEKSRLQIFKLDLVTHGSTKKVLSFTGNGSSSADLRQKAVAQALHSVCTFFDDEVAVSRDSKDDKGAIDAAAGFTDGDADESQYQTLVNALKASNKQVGVEIYSGRASGNNTTGTVLGIFDVNTNEIALFANTNCGSDD